MDKERINFRKEYLQSLHPEDLSHLRKHFQTTAPSQGPPMYASLKSSEDAADNECGFIEL